MRKKSKKQLSKDFYEKNYEYFARLGWAMFCGFQVGMSHPYVRLDMAPEFDNHMIVSLGRSVYQFLSSKKGQELWEIRKNKYSKESYDELADYYAELSKIERTLPNIFNEEEKENK